MGASFDIVQTRAALASNGLASTLDPLYRRSGLNAQFDSRTSPGYSRRGGLYRVEWTDFSQSNGTAHGFRRIDAEVQQLVPLMRENWVLAFRALASTTDSGRGQDVPYFLMPDLGGTSMLRGYSAWRFRDRHRMLLTGEYRWTAGPLVDMAVFVDAGKVAARRADLDFRHLAVSHGVGIRFHTPSSTVMRLEVARSREGTSLIASFSPSF
jgi:outer membrane protein assembly factor BamA